MLPNILNPAKIIALDAEFAEGRELLELAVVDFNANQILLQRFRPESISEWSDVKIHGISPEMVKDCPSFNQCIPSIQHIIDNADYIIGFAVAENDIPKMKHQGILRLEKKCVLELRDWFWLCHGKEAGLDYSTHINLEKCCTELHIAPADDNDKFHSAIFDTKATLQAFKILLERFISSHPKLTDASFNQIVEIFIDEFAEAKEDYDRENGAGYASITLLPSGLYRFRTSKFPLEQGNIIASIEVASRKKALIHFSQLFTGEIHERKFEFSKLSPKKLHEFNAYTNEFHGDEEKLASKLLQLNKKWKR